MFLLGTLDFRCRVTTFGFSLDKSSRVMLFLVKIFSSNFTWKKIRKEREVQDKMDDVIEIKRKNVVKK